MLSVHIIFSTCLDDDHAAILHLLPHGLRLARLDVFHARDIRLKGEGDKVEVLHLFFCELQEAPSRVEARPRIAEEAKLSRVRPCLADTEGEDGGISRCVDLQRRPCLLYTSDAADD